MCYERGGRSLEREDEKLGMAGGICVWEAAGWTWFCFLMQLLLYKKKKKDSKLDYYWAILM